MIHIWFLSDQKKKDDDDIEEDKEMKDYLRQFVGIEIKKKKVRRGLNLGDLNILGAK